MILIGMDSNTKIWGAKIETIIENIKTCIMSEESSKIEENPLTFLHIQNSNQSKPNGTSEIDLEKYSEQDLTLY